jgi:hypothetical protein
VVEPCKPIDPTQPVGFPKVGRTPYRIALSQEEASRFLVLSALEKWSYPRCDADCEVCNGFLACWWDVYNTLPRARRLSIALEIATHNAGLPDAPWEDNG